ncbi:mitochondrial chaperone Frataxin [Xylaria bambusicola]|uniref:mitochondrial chaperone Frataxin n=1 Tax=Xylaria bambusicola TaxID=326684 RepID=UPI0020082233|nr:mitochondrial chaperone Frataxin [Xylaria bambusicola]KAI0518318.1 mitochondrial chaperone Frataxin [Xylaria bambusicola]
MARTNVVRLASTAVRGLAIRSTASSSVRKLAFSKQPTLAVRPTFRSPFSTSQRLAKPLWAEDLKRAMPANITEEEFHQLADEYIDKLILQYEALQDKRIDIDVEYSSGVMNLTINDIGTYVINKQPPNKQIWLSSPISGPKRYDWVIISEGQDQKQDTATSDWIYLRDGSSLSEILRNETGVDIEATDRGEP